MVKSWKTTISGILVLACVGIYWAGIIDASQLLTGIGVLAGAGLLASKDSNVTGGTTPQ